jgi:hypothetical protein
MDHEIVQRPPAYIGGALHAPSHTLLSITRSIDAPLEDPQFSSQVSHLQFENTSLEVSNDLESSSRVPDFQFKATPLEVPSDLKSSSRTSHFLFGLPSPPQEMTCLPTPPEEMLDYEYKRPEVSTYVKKAPNNNFDAEIRALARGMGITKPLNEYDAEEAFAALLLIKLSQESFLARLDAPGESIFTSATADSAEAVSTGSSEDGSEDKAAGLVSPSASSLASPAVTRPRTSRGARFAAASGPLVGSASPDAGAAEPASRPKRKLKATAKHAAVSAGEGAEETAEEPAKKKAKTTGKRKEFSFSEGDENHTRGFPKVILGCTKYIRKAGTAEQRAVLAAAEREADRFYYLNKSKGGAKATIAGVKAMFGKVIDNAVYLQRSRAIYVAHLALAEQNRRRVAGGGGALLGNSAAFMQNAVFGDTNVTSDVMKYFKAANVFEPALIKGPIRINPALDAICNAEIGGKLLDIMWEFEQAVVGPTGAKHVLI